MEEHARTELQFSEEHLQAITGGCAECDWQTAQYQEGLIGKVTYTNRANNARLQLNVTTDIDKIASLTSNIAINDAKANIAAYTAESARRRLNYLAHKPYIG